MMPFEFVDNNATISHTARKRIRSHVAIGRNAGKKLVRPSRKAILGPMVKDITAVIRTPKAVEKAYSSEVSKDVFPQIERQVGDGLSVLSFPEQPTKSKALVQRGMCRHL